MQRAASLMRDVRRVAAASVSLVLLVTTGCRPEPIRGPAPAPRCYAFAALLDTSRAEFQPRVGNPVHLPPRAARFDWTPINPVPAGRRAGSVRYLEQYDVTVPVDDRKYPDSGFWVPSGDSIWVVFGSYGFWYASVTFPVSDTATLARAHTVDDMGPRFGYDVRVEPTDCGAYEWAPARIGTDRKP